MAATRRRSSNRKSYPTPQSTRQGRSTGASPLVTTLDGQEFGGLKEVVRLTAATLSDLLRRAMPSDIQTCIREALGYARGEDDLVQDIVNTKIDFYSSGLAISVKPSNANNKRSLSQRVDEMIRVHQLKQIAEELIFFLVSCDNAILQWKVESGRLQYVNTLEPDMVDYGRVAGVETLKVRLPHDVITRIQSAIGRKQIEELKKYFPKKYIDAVSKGTNEVELSNEDGEFWIVRTHNKRFGGLAKPSMTSRFADITLRRLLICGDWATAYLFKNAIEHITVGDRVSGTSRESARELYPSGKDLENLEKIFKKLGQAARLFTDHTVKVQYPHPDPEIFNGVKYEKVEERIIRWGGVIEVLMTGKGEGFSQGHLGVRRFIAHGRRIRDTVGDMIAGFMLHPSILDVFSIPGNTSVEVSWNEQNLKDPEQVLKELQSLWDRGTLDPRTFHERLGLKHDQIRERMVQYHEEDEIWKLDWEAKQGMNTPGNEAGRPASGQPQPAPSTRPKKSKTGE